MTPLKKINVDQLFTAVQLVILIMKLALMTAQLAVKEPQSLYPHVANELSVNNLSQENTILVDMTEGCRLCNPHSMICGQPVNSV